MEKVEAMTPMLKKKKEEEEEKKKGFEGQLTTLEASFRLKTVKKRRIRLKNFFHLDEIFRSNRSRCTSTKRRATVVKTNLFFA